jgi:hypothetical protein
MSVLKRGGDKKLKEEAYSCLKDRSLNIHIVFKTSLRMMIYIRF